MRTVALAVVALAALVAFRPRPQADSPLAAHEAPVDSLEGRLEPQEPEPKAEPARVVVEVPSRGSCPACDRFKAQEAPKLVEAGVVVEYQRVLRPSYPRFRLYAPNGREFRGTGFMTAERILEVFDGADD